MNDLKILGFAEHFPMETDTSVNFVILFDWTFEIKVLLVKSQLSAFQMILGEEQREGRERRARNHQSKQ